MNRKFTQLARLVRQCDPGIDDAQLAAALKLLTYPRSLSRVIPACQRLTDLAAASRNFESSLSQSAQDGLLVLRLIAELPIRLSAAVADEYLNPDGRSASKTPLRPYSGDGPAAEALLTIPEWAVHRADGSDNGVQIGSDHRLQVSWDQWVSWWVWSCIQFSQKWVSTDAYCSYLFAHEEPPRLLKSTRIHVARQALYTIRAYGYLEPAVTVDGEVRPLPDFRAVAALDLALDSNRAKLLARLIVDAHSQPTANGDLLSEYSELSGKSLVEALQDWRTLSDLPGALRVFLEYLWSPDYRPVVRGQGASARRRIQDAAQRHYRGQLGIFEGWRLESEPDDPEAPDEGVSGDVNIPREPTHGTDDDELEPEDHTGYEPDVSLYIAEGKVDHGAVFYRAKARRHRTEFSNAWLHWSPDRLSSDALNALVQLLEPTSTSTRAENGGRWLLGLSLLTGRRIKDLASMEASEDAEALLCVQPDASVCWDTSKDVLWVRAGTSKLSSDRERYRHCFYPRSEFLRVRLPSVLSRILVALNSNPIPGKSASIWCKRARQLIKNMPPELAVTESRVRDALCRQLLAEFDDDTALVGTVTDRKIAGSSNILHYASFGQGEVEAAWRGAANILFDSCTAPVMPVADPDLRVGSREPIRPSVVRAIATEIKRRLHAALADEAPYERIHNLLTLYTYLRSNLALVTRGSKFVAAVALIDPGWALVIDKGRDDGSVDRLVPVTEGYLAQSHAYLNVVWQMAGLDSRLRPLCEALREGINRYQYFEESGEAVPFSLSAALRAEGLPEIPGNWARKLVRSESRHVGGRMLEAVLGHFVQGRHAWRMTSTLDAPAFFRRWRQEAERLETMLGLDELIVPFRDLQPIVPWPPTRFYPAQLRTSDADDPVTPRSAEQLRRELNRIDAGVVAELDRLAAARRVGRSDSDSGGDGRPAPPEAPAALDLAVALLRERSKSKPSRAELLNEAEVICEWVRNEWALPIFVQRPRGRFERDWTIDRNALANLSHIQRVVLPKFEKDLVRLPAPECEAVASDADVGRLLMLLIWRIRLVNWGAIRSFLGFLQTSQFIAVGTNRAVIIEVPFRFSSIKMQRTIWLDDYTSIFCLAEQTRLAKRLAALWNEKDQTLRARLQRCVLAYLRRIGAPEPPSCLSVMMEASRQDLMLNASPILASYARGDLLTTDISLDVHGRIAGFEAPPPDLCRPSTLVGNLKKLWGDSNARPRVGPESRDLIGRLCSVAPRRRDDRVNAIMATTCDSSAARLVRAFAAYLVSNPKGRQAADLLSAGVISTHRRHLEIVGLPLLGVFTQIDAEQPVLDGSLIEELAELSELLASDVGRGVQVAWNRFREFARNDVEAIRSAGWHVGYIGRDAEPEVHANLLSSAEMSEVDYRLQSVLSGIGNPRTREVSRRTFGAIRATGARRSEIEFLRVCDRQGELIRFQPWEGHTLKTAWANRVLPASLIVGDHSNGKEDSGGAADCRLISGIDQQAVGAYNFNDQINKVIQLATGDGGTHQHTARHSVVSGLIYAMTRNPLGEKGFPGAELIDPAACLMKSIEPKRGWFDQGMQQASAEIGHSHPTTSIKHYGHLFGLALATHVRSKHLPLTRAFVNRMARSRATLERIAAKAEAQLSAASELDGRVAILNRLVADLLAEAEGGTPKGTIRAAAASKDHQLRGPDTAAFAACEQLEWTIRESDMPLVAAELALPVERLRRISEIAVQQRPRHKLERVRGVALPPRLKAGGPSLAACAVTNWLELLRADSPQDFGWVLDRYLGRAKNDEGRMLMNPRDPQDRVSRIRSILTTPDIELWVVPTRRAAKRLPKAPDPLLRQQPSWAYELKICVLSEAGPPEPRKHTVQAVAWAVIYMAALHGYPT